MNRKYDVIVIGAGHNGLVTASLLAKRGRKVLLLEKRAQAGGLAASEEFFPGYRTPGVLHDTSALRPWVIEDLGLTRHGLKLREDHAPILSADREGRGLLLWRDARRAEDEIGALSPRDARSYAAYRAFVDRIAPFWARIFDEFPLDVLGMSFPGLWDLMKKAVSLRLLGKADMMEVLRIAPMCVADWLHEWFENDRLKATLAAPALCASYTGPWSPGTTANLLMAETLARPSVVGGAQAVAKALLAAATAQGVELRTACEVRRVIVKAGRVQGVELADGTVETATKVAAACDPKHLFLDLIESAHLTQRLEHNILHVRARGTTAKVCLALSAYPEWRARPGLKAEFIRIAEGLEAMERAFDAVKYRQMSEEPWLDLYVPTLEAPELAPAGGHVLSILVHYAPYDLEGGWSESRREDIYQRVRRTLSAYAPGIEALIQGGRVWTPEDLQRDYNLSGGHIFHGEHAADQLLVRPTPECARYSTPIAGLYLCGSGAHPGGGVTGAPGGFAARVLASSVI